VVLCRRLPGVYIDSSPEVQIANNRMHDGMLLLRCLISALQIVRETEILFYKCNRFIQFEKRIRWRKAGDIEPNFLFVLFSLRKLMLSVSRLCLLFWLTFRPCGWRRHFLWLSFELFRVTAQNTVLFISILIYERV
jgi:hypothetical protein